MTQCQSVIVQPKISSKLVYLSLASSSCDIKTDAYFDKVLSPITSRAKSISPWNAIGLFHASAILLSCSGRMICGLNSLIIATDSKSINLVLSTDDTTNFPGPIFCQISQYHKRSCNMLHTISCKNVLLLGQPISCTWHSNFEFFTSINHAW